MAASCNLVHLPFPKTPNFASPHPFARSFSLPTPPRRSFPISSASSTAAGPIGPVEPAFANPAVGHANVMFFRSGYNVQIVVDEDESEEALLRRFRREVSKAGVIQECKRRRFFENKQEEKKRKAREAGRRNRRRRLGPRFNASSPQADADAAKKAKEDDDNWDLPVGDLPY